jgi:hypothetical protein
MKRVGLYALSAIFLVIALYTPKLVLGRLLDRLFWSGDWKTVILSFVVKYLGFALLCFPILCVSVALFFIANRYRRDMEDIHGG